MKYWKIVSTTLFLLISSSVNAIIISTDWQTSGDNLITHDTETGLEWLDLTVTQGVSVDEILNGYGGLIEAGFRYATTEEISAYVTSVGVDLNQEPIDGDDNGIIQLRELWGATTASLNAGYFLHSPFTQQSPDQAVRGYFDFTEPGWGEINLTLDTQLHNSNNIINGSALVRITPVPTPATIWLFGSGIIGLFGFAKRGNKYH